MTYHEIMAVAFSIISLLFVVWNRNHSLILLKESAREQHSCILIEIDKLSIEHPDLWAIYDNHILSKIKSTQPKDIAKREAMIYLYFNMFEIVFYFYNHVIKKNKVDYLY